MEHIVAFLRQHGLAAGAPCRFQHLAGDGSSRPFVRVQPEGGPSLLVVGPDPANPRGLAEARACYRIGVHLAARGVPVPAILAFTEETGLIAFEDLGDLRLHDLVARDADRRLRHRHYEEAVSALVVLQVEARAGFDPAWCWDTPVYDRELMLARESGYFLRELWQGFLGRRELPARLEEELEVLATRAGAAPGGYLLHRDFQSRNLMLHRGRIRIIDFQGARLGPLGYDLASLLIDPYAALSREEQDALLERYLAALASYPEIDRAAFLETYSFLALQRNLQVLGAFGFLTKKRGKPFFAAYVRPAAKSLTALLNRPELAQFPLLRATANAIVEQIT